MKVLVTGKIFIEKEHVKLLEDVGVEVERLDKLVASEKELVSALVDKDGYILGGLEKVTEKVVASCPKLKVISFTGAGWKQFVPGHSVASQKGILITAAAGANAQAVAEYAIGLLHDRIRHITYLSGEGSGEIIQARNFRDLTIGIVGVGNVGSKVARILSAAYGSDVIYCSPNKNLDLEYGIGANRASFESLLSSSDVVMFHMSKNENSIGMMDKQSIALLKPGAILVNCSFSEAFDSAALLEQLKKGQISVASDADLSNGDDTLRREFESVSSRYYLQSGAVSAYNTETTVKVASVAVIQSMLSIFLYGQDQSVVNPRAYASDRIRKLRIGSKQKKMFQQVLDEMLNYSSKS